MKTYTRMGGSIRSFARDIVRLYKVRTRDISGDVRTTVEQTRALEENYSSLTGKPLHSRDVLVLGAGQTAREVVAFGVKNRMTAIDLDVIPQGWKPGPYVKLLRENGPTRAIKTVGRKALGIDRRFQSELCSSLGVSKPNPATYLQMNAEAMTFPKETFDLVYSFSVFEHLPDPDSVLQEVCRVLRPGGVASISVHIYSAEGGCHDLRIFAGDRESIPLWAHLRPQHKHTVVESCYMNEWSLQRWRELFQKHCPGAVIETDPHEGAFGQRLANELRELRSKGELAVYSDDDLLTVNYRVIWKKPDA